MNLLVTGGAGYVGSIVTEELLKDSHKVIVLDNLQQGHKGAVLPEAEFVPADICDAQALEDVFLRFKIDAVMHMAAETVVEYSMTDPKRYFRNNVVGGMNLLDTMLKHNVHKLIFFEIQDLVLLIHFHNAYFPWIGDLKEGEGS